MEQPVTETEVTAVADIDEEPEFSLPGAAASLHHSTVRL